MRSCFEGLHKLPAGLDTFCGSNDKSSIEPVDKKLNSINVRLISLQLLLLLPLTNKGTLIH
jgi:hypothetical protein